MTLQTNKIINGDQNQINNQVVTLQTNKRRVTLQINKQTKWIYKQINKHL